MPRITRRHALKSVAATAAVLTLAPKLGAAPVAQAQPAKGPFTLPKLPYAYDALAPHISKRTMMIHHDRHHLAYVNGLNTAVAGNADLQKMTVEQLLRNINKVPMAIRQAVINNGGGHANHSFFWEIMGPKQGGEPAGDLGKAIAKTFGSFKMFQTQLRQAGLTRFGSGWAWLVVNKGQLAIESSANQDSPLMAGKTPILGVDVWEHAYYLDYENMRPNYLDAWWNVVNWPVVAQKYTAAIKNG